MNVTREQWVEWHRLITESPNFIQEITVLFNGCPKSEAHSIEIGEFRDAAHLDCLAALNDHGFQLELLPDWVQVLWDKAMEST